MSCDVSVIIPTYNRADMLREAINSVLAQTLAPKEIIVVDDGSSDHTRQVLASLSGGALPMMTLTGAHVGRPGQARNKGAAAASGALLAFLDSDDIWEPLRLELQLAAWEKAPQAGFSFCNLRLFNENGPLRGPHLDPAKNYSGRILGETLLDARAASSTLMVRKNVLERVGGFRDLPLNEDYELTLRLAAAYSACYVPDILVHMRDHANRVSRRHEEETLLSYIEIVEKFLAEHRKLSPDIKASGRLGLANARVKLTRSYLQSGHRAEGKRQLFALARVRPWDRRLPNLLRQLIAPKAKPHEAAKPC